MSHPPLLSANPARHRQGQQRRARTSSPPDKAQGKPSGAAVGGVPITAETMLENKPRPASLTARIRNWYKMPVSSPKTCCVDSVLSGWAALRALSLSLSCSVDLQVYPSIYPSIYLPT